MYVGVRVGTGDQRAVRGGKQQLAGWRTPPQAGLASIGDGGG